MRRPFLILGLVLVLLLVALWASGGYGVVLAWATERQREAQSALAAAIRQLRAGQAGAMAALLAVSFSYGFLHAAGPGHGKVLIGGYGLAQRVRLLPLAAIAIASSMAQALVAVLLVYGFVAVLGWTRQQMEGVAENVMVPVGALAVAGVGLWLFGRGIRRLWRQRPVAHDHVHGPDCGHSHGPSLDEVSRLTGWRDVAALIGGIALRPCTGALFLLILTWQMGIGLAGIAGTFAMGLGTASVTVAVAVLSVWAREGALASLPGSRVARALPWFEVLAGALVVVLAVGLVSQGR